MIRASIRFLCLTAALSIALTFLLPAFLLAGAFYLLAAVFSDGPSYYHTPRS